MPHRLVLLSCTLASVALAADWAPHGERDGVTVESRRVAGTALEEVRATATSTASAAAMCGAIWGRADQAREPEFRAREVVRETATERWTYERIAAPVVSDRDYVLHARLEARADGGCRVHLTLATDVGPPPQHGVVRLAALRGVWDVLPAGSGARVVYTLFSDPGGGVPAFLVRGPQRDKAVQWMKRMLVRAARAQLPR